MRRTNTAAVAVAAMLGAAIMTAPATARVPQVLRVGSFHGIPGQFGSIQAAVDAARPGDWVLVAPGDYKTAASAAPSGHEDTQAAVLITTARLRLRGMDRNRVVLDGTRPGSPACSSAPADQNLGPAGTGSSGPVGLNGVMVWKAADVSVDNLTTCNFLGGSGNAGNGVWWNGGDGSGQIGGYGFEGSYLTATSTYYMDEATAAAYGIFSSNWDGGSWNQIYASNMNDSGFYIGACRQLCHQVVDHAHAQYNALGYSGSNSGGSLVVENSEFDHNEDGFDTNSQNGDNPPPQNGACPGNGFSPITHTHSCWVFMHNYVHDNNNPDVPSSGLAAAGPVGTGISVSGGRNDTIIDNRFVNNDAWGVIFVPFSDSGPPCTGGTANLPSPGGCLYDEWGDALFDNAFSHNGAYRHPTNGDFAALNLESGHPTSCAHGNTDAGGTFTSSPAGSSTTVGPRRSG
ncbi:MAG: nucleotidyltransferase family protein [Actinobacteria bacterium]|nr:nucleotidyltransferase family protein [Actinomycetota bacterium]